MDLEGKGKILLVSLLPSMRSAQNGGQGAKTPHEMDAGVDGVLRHRENKRRFSLCLPVDYRADGAGKPRISGRYGPAASSIEGTVHC